MGFLRNVWKSSYLRVILLRGLPGIMALGVIPLFTAFHSGLQAQEEGIPLEISQDSAPAEASRGDSEEGLFFSDVLVRGQPVFQVGSLSSLSADNRAQIINRRIAGLLNQSRSLEPVTVQFDPSRQIALLNVNNRVLMTVTQQDAMDFDTTVETLAQQRTEQLNQVLTQPNLAVDVLQRLDGTSRQLARRTLDLNLI